MVRFEQGRDQGVDLLQQDQPEELNDRIGPGRRSIIVIDRQLTGSCPAVARQLASSWRIQIEAAIQSTHAHRAVSGQTDWHGIARLYSVLAVAHPSLGASIGWAAALSRVGAGDRGLSVLDALPADRVAAHQAYWAVRAHILADTGGHTQAAAAAYQRAIGLTDDPAVRAWLAAQAEHLRLP